MNITATDFIGIWSDFMDRKTANDEWMGHWNTNSGWSDFILGGKRSSNKDSPIGQYIQNIYGKEKLGFRSEDGSVDLSFFDKSSVFSFHALDRNWKQYPFTKEDYPSHYLALIEHENDIYTSWEEIAKLSYYRSRLKVLITYHSSDDLAEDKREMEFKMLEDSFQDVLNKSNGVFPEHESTEYLLIVGGKVGKELVWENSIFNSTGQKKTV